MSVRYKRQDYIDYIKLMLTGNLLELEIPDETLGKFVDAALTEIQKYIDEPCFVTVPFNKVIDLKKLKEASRKRAEKDNIKTADGKPFPGFDYSSIVNIYRSQGLIGDSSSGSGMDMSDVDPMYAQTWMVFSNGGTMYNMTDYVMNYMSYNTLMQMRNTLGTPLSFKEDKLAEKLYVNSMYDTPAALTIEYIPIYKSVEYIVDEHWIDALKKLALALAKIAIGRIRTYAKQTNALWEIDGETILAEGNAELDKIREELNLNYSKYYILD